MKATQSSPQLRRMMVLSLLSWLLIATVEHPTPVSAAYNCSTPHCYSIAYWYGGMAGAFTYDYVINIYSGDNAGERINNELWVQDDHPVGLCVTQGFSACWSEVGYTYIPGTDTARCQGFQHYFHASETPSSGYVEPCDWTWHIGLYNYDYQAEPAVYTFIDPTYTYFAAVVVSPALGTLTAYTPTFAAYQVNPDLIWAGQEVTGHQYASSEIGSWAFNKWIAPRVLQFVLSGQASAV